MVVSREPRIPYLEKILPPTLLKGQRGVRECKFFSGEGAPRRQATPLKTESRILHDYRKISLEQKKKQKSAGNKVIRFRKSCYENLFAQLKVDSIEPKFLEYNVYVVP